MDNITRFFHWASANDYPQYALDFGSRALWVFVLSVYFASGPLEFVLLAAAGGWIWCRKYLR